MLRRDVWAGPKEPATNYVLVALFCLGESVPSSFVLAETTIQQLCYPSMGVSGSCEQGASVAALLSLLIPCCCCSITHQHALLPTLQKDPHVQQE